MSGRPRVCAVIMAGGSGTRFWPLSRKSRPKQFLPIASDKTMIEETVERLRPLLPPEEIYTISNKAQAAAIRKLIPDLPRENILVEPQARNTAASLILATARAYHRNPKSVVLALPADHLIAKPDVFIRKLRAAAAAAAHEDVIVTFGIPPTFPSTGFGYIHFANVRRRFAGEDFHPVLRFTEKPARGAGQEVPEAGEAPLEFRDVHLPGGGFRAEAREVFSGIFRLLEKNAGRDQRKTTPEESPPPSATSRRPRSTTL